MGSNDRSNEDLGHPLEYDPDFKGPCKRRSCTDVICLFLFLTFLASWAGIAIYAYTSGDPNTLLVPKDSRGSRCGLDENVKDKPYLFFFDLTKCIDPKVIFTGCPTPQICVKECPSESYIWDANGKEPRKLICDYGIDNSNLAVSDAEKYIKDKKCAAWYLQSQPFEKRCIPLNYDQNLLNIIGKDKFLESISHMKLLNQAEEFTQSVIDDVINSWWKILLGIGITVVTCIIYIVMMRWLASIMVWISLIGVTALLAAATYFTAKKYIEIKDSPKENEISNLFEKKSTWLALLIIVSILLVIIVLMIIFLRKRILLAIALLKEGSKAVSSATSVLFFPIVHWILQLAVIFFALSVALFLATTGEPVFKYSNLNNDITSNICIDQINGKICDPGNITPECYDNMIERNGTCKFTYIKNPKFYPYLQAINAFGFLWGAFFVTAMGQMILASVFATWYWTWNKKDLPFFALIEATGQTLYYHTGTLAFGSLIITICRAIRIMLEYVDRQLKKYDNPFTRAVMCFMKCFFWCLEKFLKFINRNAYVMCAIHGKNFCASAKDAFLLLMRNIVRVFVLDYVTDFIFFVGKLVITFGVGAICYVLFATDLTAIDNGGLNYNLVPVVAVMICAYFISTIFFNVYSMAVDTLFLCFLEDCERNDGSDEKPYFMSRNLMNIFGKKNKTKTH